jgi:hypothetical protein
MASIGELFVTLGVDADTIKLNDFAMGLLDVGLKAAGVITTLAGISLALKDVYSSTMDSAIGFEKFGHETGLSTEPLQKWQIAAKLAGVDANIVAGSIKNMQQKMDDIKYHGGDATAFKMLHIDPTQNPYTALQQLMGNMHNGILKNMPKSEFIHYLRDAGLNEDFGIILDKFDKLGFKSKEFQEYYKSLFGAEQQANMLAFRDQLSQMSAQFDILSHNVMGNVIPAVTSFLKFIPELGKEIKWAIPGILALAGILGGIYHTSVWSAIIATRTFTMALLTNPIFLFIAALSALILALDDFYKYKHGNKNTLSGKVVEAVSRPITAQSLLDSFSSPSGLGTGQFVKALGAYSPSAFSGIQALFTPVTDMFKNLATFIPNISGLTPAMSSTNANNVVINVHSNQNPKSIADEVAITISRILGQTNSQIDTQRH